MPCNYPIQAYRSNQIGPNGKKVIVFDSKKGNIHTALEVPCGKCIGCRLDRSRMWAMRCSLEASMHQVNSFVTLNYADENKTQLGLQKGISKNPRRYGKEVEYVLAPTVKEDLQNFIKKLRHRKPEVRYYACSEYGEFGPGHHPHYHICLFGTDFKYSGVVPGQDPEGDILYKSEELEELWPHGFHSIGAVNAKTAGYTARYCTKKINGELAKHHYTVVDRFTGRRSQVPTEQAYMSRDPGIGATWYDKYKDDIKKDYLQVEGKMYAIPRYFRERLEETHPEIAKRNKRRRGIERKKREKDNTPDRNVQKATVKERQFKMLERSHENAES